MVVWLAERTYDYARGEILGVYPTLALAVSACADYQRDMGDPPFGWIRDDITGWDWAADFGWDAYSGYEVRHVVVGEHLTRY